MNVPDGLRYSKDHEWVRVDGDVAIVGITDYAQDALGDVVYIDPPTVGSSLVAGDSLGEVESTKSVSELYAPVSGTVASTNDELETEPEKLNTDPYGEGWICTVTMSEVGELDALMDSEAYQTFFAG